MMIKKVAVLAAVVVSMIGFNSANASPRTAVTRSSETFQSVVASGFNTEMFTTFASSIASQFEAVASDTALNKVPNKGASPNDSPICYVHVDDPHNSTGAKGVIAKTRFICESGKAQFYQKAIPELFACSSQPPDGYSSNTNLSQYGCSARQSETYTSISVGSGQTVTRYVPDTGKPGAKGSAYWAVCTGYELTTSTIYYACSYHAPWIAA